MKENGCTVYEKELFIKSSWQIRSCNQNNNFPATGLTFSIGSLPILLIHIIIISTTSDYFREEYRCGL